MGNMDMARWLIRVEDERRCVRRSMSFSLQTNSDNVKLEGARMSA